MVNERNRIGGLNQIGLRRSGMPREQITELRRAFRDVLRTPMPRKEAVAILRERGATCGPVNEIAEFIESSKRGVCPGMGKPARGARSASRAEELEVVADD
jgi:UDP-N-acetylglucosamine acyltransferase